MCVPTTIAIFADDTVRHSVHEEGDFVIKMFIGADKLLEERIMFSIRNENTNSLI